MIIILRIVLLLWARVTPGFMAATVALIAVRIKRLGATGLAPQVWS
jgi:hypothetical protein